MGSLTGDHTAFDFDLNPTKMMMTGYARHGNTPFHCPVISKISDNMYQGGCEDNLVLPEFITDVVSLYKWEQYTIEHEIRSLLTIEMYDDAKMPINRDEIIALAEWVNNRRKTGTVLVHCQAGLNRSALVSATALVLGGMHPAAAIRMLRDARSPAVLCNKLFQGFVEGLEFTDYKAV